MAAPHDSVDTPKLTAAELQAIEEKFDPELRFRTLGPTLTMLCAVILFLLSCYHFYTAGFGIPRATTHNGIHMGTTLFVVFLSFAAFGKRDYAPGLRAPLGLPIEDWVLAIAGGVTAMYVPWIYDQLAFRVGNPLLIDVVMGTILIIVLLEATRRSMGWPLPVIAILFMAYAYFGQSMPGILVHPGASWAGIVNHLYLTSQGIYGTALGVIATYVFHFVLFGVMATRIGLGQLFIDIASAAAGRYAGGPAKVSVLSSALLGSISGSSIANTVTTGALTIPAMIRIGYPRHFAAAVEAAASTGGQITPPVMGAVAFLMIEYLGVPLTTILTAALVPAFMHFYGVLMQVHLEARRLGLRGLSPEEIPNVLKVLKEGWLTLLPLFLLIAVLLSGRTPFAAAFYAIIAAPILGLLGVEPLVAHFFVFYYGVLADITPPVALAAYAASGIAGANAFKAGNTAFRLSMGKVMVPFVFVFSPSVLIVTDGFTWEAFILAVTGMMLGIWMLSAAVSGWLFAPLWKIERAALALAAILLVAPNLTVTIIGLVIIAPVMWRGWRVREGAVAT
jgi:TRAP-type uncharacterized transport system fused permease subunit